MTPSSDNGLFLQNVLLGERATTEKIIRCVKVFASTLELLHGGDNKENTNHQRALLVSIISHSM